MAELYHLLQMFFSAILFLISCIGSIGQFLYPWGQKTEHKKEVGVQQHNLSHPAGSQSLNGAKIEYPQDMEKQRKGGKVVLNCDIEITGETSNCHVVQSSGEDAFDREALRFTSHARYKPAMKNGVPVKEYAHQYTITFKLNHNIN